MASMRESTKLVVTTFGKNEGYAGAIADLLDAFWPGHPDIVWVTDRGEIERGRVLVQPSPHWVTVLRAGLKRLREESPELQKVFVLLDDHCPLRPVDVARVEQVFRAASEHDLAAVCFPTYPWPWDHTSDVPYADGKIRTWPKIQVVHKSGQRLAVVPEKFFRYFQVQPAFWDLDYLVAVCEEAEAKESLDAWTFEGFDYSAKRPHYVSAYDWPSVHHGFLAHGRANPEAIEALKMPEGRTLRDRLLRSSQRVPSMRLFYWLKGARYLRQRLRNAVHKARKLAHDGP